MSLHALQKPLHILVIARNKDDVRHLENELAEVAPKQFILECVATVDDALVSLTENDYDLLILDISLPGGDGEAMYQKIHEASAETPMVVLTDLDDEEVAVSLVHQGAQDYIVKGHVNTKHIAQSLRYAIERENLREKLVNQALVDELTGLYNRRGFLGLAQQQLHMAQRTKRPLLLFFIDLDGLKKTNDSLGHHAGDMALADVAAILRASFRLSDIISRIGGDEFAVLAMETDARNRETVQKRILRNAELISVRNNRPYSLGLSMGVATYDPDSRQTIEALLAVADTLMYQEKRRRKAERI